MSRLMKWLFSATPKITPKEQTTPSPAMALAEDLNKIVTNERVPVELAKPDSKLYQLDMHTPDIEALVEISKSIVYQIEGPDVYRNVKDRMTRVTVSYYLGDNQAAIGRQLADILSIANHYSTKQQLSYKERCVLHDMASIVKCITFLLNFDKDETWNSHQV